MLAQFRAPAHAADAGPDVVSDSVTGNNPSKAGRSGHALRPWPSPPISGEDFSFCESPGKTNCRKPRRPMPAGTQSCPQLRTRP